MSCPNLGFDPICQKNVFVAVSLANHCVLFVSTPYMFCEKTVKIGKLFGLVEPKTCQKCPDLGTLPVTA